MPAELRHQIAILERTPSVLSAMLDGLDEAWLTTPYAPGAFSPYHVVGHLIIGEREDWIPRARIILEHGTSRPFEPFGHRSTIEPGEGPDIEGLLDELATLRAQNLEALRSFRLDAAGLALEGTHPDQAIGRVSMRQLIAGWATHDLHHIAQVCKGLAFHNRDAVGAWRASMGIIPPG